MNEPIYADKLITKDDTQEELQSIYDRLVAEGCDVWFEEVPGERKKRKGLVRIVRRMNIVKMVDRCEGSNKQKLLNDAKKLKGDWL